MRRWNSEIEGDDGPNFINKKYGFKLEGINQG